MPISKRSPNSSQTGAITIMVALMMLVLLTIAAVSMSRNSFQQIVASAFSRQSAMTRDMSDSGIEWAIYWMDIQNSQSPTAGAATQLASLQSNLRTTPSMWGSRYDVMTGAAYTAGSNPVATFTPATGGTQSFTVALTEMGKLPVSNTSQGAGPGAYAPASGALAQTAPDLWAVRVDAQVKPNSSVVFTHAKEAWVSTPVQ